MRDGVLNLDADSLARATELAELAGDAISRATDATPLT